MAKFVSPAGGDKNPALMLAAGDWAGLFMVAGSVVVLVYPTSAGARRDDLQHSAGR